MRASVLSAGAWSAVTHIPTLRSLDDVELVAVTSPDLDKARHLQNQFGFAHAFDDYREALAQNPDVVIVSSPPAFHREMVIDALQAGADVLCEKPFATSVEDARAMCDTARQLGRNLLSGYGWIHMPMFAEAARLVTAGELGTLEFLSVSLTVNVRELLSEGMPYSQVTDSLAPEAATYTDPRVSGGGAAAVSMTHAFAVLLAIAGRPVESLFARTYPANDPIDLHDDVSVGFEGGAIGVVTCTSVHDASEPVRWRVEACGSEGSIWIDSLTGHWLHQRKDGSSAQVDLPDDFARYDAGAPTRTLVECRRTGSAHPLNNVDLAQQTAELMVATYRSSESGSQVVPAEL